MKKVLFLAALLSLTFRLEAKVKPASLIGDGMVLQQQSEVRLWGWAKPNATVRLTTSWKAKATTKADNEGRWELWVKTPVASFASQELTLSDGEKLTIRDVLIGEVWVGSGQSNMEMCLVGRPNRTIEHANRELLQANRFKGMLRMATVAHNEQKVPVDSVKVQWQDCSTQVVAPWSAVCYFFATTLIEALQCPVGMISTCWGGTSVESWSPKEVLPPVTDAKKQTDYAVRYNGLIHPLEGYTIRGFIWYQGEANVSRHAQYANMLSEMITSWRKRWKQGPLPFYQVEIAPYIYDGAEKNRAALLREAQLEVSHRLEKVGIVCTNDLVKDFELRQIHPMMKREIGERLAYLALNNDYGFKGLYAFSPEYKSMEVKGKEIVLNFTHAEKGFNRFEGFKGFEVSGVDRKFYPAEVRVEGTRLVVSSPKVEAPVAVHYCFKNWQLGNTTNVGGMPLFPFRTDK